MDQVSNYRFFIFCFGYYVSLKDGHKQPSWWSTIFFFKLYFIAIEYFSVLCNVCCLFCVYQEDANTVDFILISQPLKSDIDPGISDSLHLFSHHACHCRQDSNETSWLWNWNSISYFHFPDIFLILFLFSCSNFLLQYCKHKPNIMGSRWASKQASWLFFFNLWNQLEDDYLQLIRRCCIRGH